MTATAETIAGLLQDRHGLALGAPGRAALSYDALSELAAETGRVLNRMGIGRNDRVAIVCPNGPEMAAAFVAIASGATAAPLNPTYRANEFDFYLTDLEAKALVVPEGWTTPARAVAEAHGIATVELRAEMNGAAGAFTLVPRGAAAPLLAGPAEERDIALILHTSGTTSRPKMVPLSHSNLFASARNIAQTLSLSPEDVCLNIMPLFHIHGLVGAVLASFAGGGQVVCTPGFNALKLFSWLEEVRPTWYTAVPTMHQAILSRAARHRETIAKGRLRLIRSSSSSLLPQVMRELEATFGVPVIESYGMTEAAHQMASNPLPPRERFPGSVGIAAGPEIAILDETGKALPPGTEGEVSIRGKNVMAGYANDSEADAKAFARGWFRTGDQGTLDNAGYLRLTGRLKELINRGGEKISPIEIDTVLMNHPAVAQVLTFAIPHAKLGEDVAAAVVLREGATVDERELRDFASEKLAQYKVPRKIVFLDEIPKGATGKLQRIGLAEKLGLAG